MTEVTAQARHKQSREAALGRDGRINHLIRAVLT